MNFTNKVVAVFCALCYLQSSDASCGRLLSYDISASGKTEIVNHINKLRKVIANGKVLGQPKGANLKRMFWDRKLAADARTVALRCSKEHYHVPDSRFMVGQHMIMFSNAHNQKLNYADAINNWFSQYTTYRFNSGAYNHYTQVVWANTYLVGCGHTNYYENNAYRHLFVCNFGPAGNDRDLAPYRTGAGCENLC